MKINVLLHIILLVLMVQSLAAQKHLADSVELLLQKQLPDSQRAITMVSRAMYYESIDTTRSRQLYNEAIEYASNKKMDYPLGYALHYSMFINISNGNYAVHAADMERAIYHLSRSLNKKAPIVLGIVMTDKASMFYKDEMYDSATAWYLKGIDIFEKEKRFDKAVGAYVNLSSVYQVINLKDKQKEYTIKGLEAAKLSGRRYDLFSAYSIMSQYYAGENDYKRALLYADSANLYFTNEMDSKRVQLFYLIRAQAFNGLEKFDSALFYYQKTYKLRKSVGDTWGMTEPLMLIGNAYWKLGKITEAEEFLKKGIELAERNNYTIFKETGYKILSKFYEEMGNAENALSAYKKYVAASDSIQVGNRKKMILDLDKKYETEKKDQQLELQQVSIRQKKLVNYILAGSFAALLLVSLLTFRNHWHKRKLQHQKIIELEKEKLLSATQSLLKGQEDERSRMAKDLHDGLGGLLSGVKLQLGAMKGNLILSEENGRAFNNALGKLDESISEMRRVAHNMMPEALMKLGLQQALQDYCDGLSESQTFKINCEFYGLGIRMPSSTEIVVYRIVQELLNNAVKHAGASTILAQVMRQDNHLSITVEDNGKGFDMTQLALLKGTGLKNIQSRVDYLQGQLDIKPTVDNGTSVHINCIIENNV